MHFRNGIQVIASKIPSRTAKLEIPKVLLAGNEQSENELFYVLCQQ